MCGISRIPRQPGRRGFAGQFIHDMTPVSHSLAVVVSVLVVGLPLALSGLSRHRTQGNAADWDRAGALGHDEEEEGDYDR